MLHAIKQNSLFLYKTIVILIMVFPFISEGATDLIPFDITSSGNISFECPDPTNLGYSNLWNVYMYETNNDFPNITRVVNSIVGINTVCSAIQNQTAENGWLNGLASTPDGYYAIVFTVNGLEDPDYTMILQRSGGNWSALSGMNNFYYDFLPNNLATTSTHFNYANDDNYSESMGISIYENYTFNISDISFILCGSTSTEAYNAFIYDGSTVVARSDTVYAPSCIANDFHYDTFTKFTFDNVSVSQGYSIIVRPVNNYFPNGGNIIRPQNTIATSTIFYSTGCLTNYTGDIYTQTNCLNSVFGGSYSIPFFKINENGTSTPPVYNCDDPTTRILNFTPLDNSTTTSPVNFTLNACINESDLGTISTVNISLHNIDQNVLLLSDFSPSDIWLLDDRDIENAGLYSFATTTVLGDGNYRLEACVKRGYLWGIFTNPFSDISDCISHQFIVGQSTFIGNISQNIWGETNGFLDGLSATTSEALAITCNPLGGSFDVRLCTTFLFVPDAKSLKDIMDNARNGILSRVPWGYFTRFAVIMTSSGTSTLPAWTVPIQVGAGSDMTPEITTISVDPSDMLAGGAQLLDSVRDPITNKSARDVFEPMVQLTIALAVLLTIVADLARMHNHSNEDRGKNNKYS